METALWVAVALLFVAALSSIFGEKWQARLAAGLAIVAMLVAAGLHIFF